MNGIRIAKAYEKIAEGFAELALAYGDDEQPRGVPSAAGPAGGGFSPRPLSAAADLPPSFDELPPDDEAAILGEIERRTGGTVVQDGPLGRCPDHDVPWKVVPAGVSKKTGKAYNAFHACPERGCNQKPTPAWLRTHAAA